MNEQNKLQHATWECKYHIVFIPKYRQKESRIEEGHLVIDHVHMLISIPPKYAVSAVIGYIKGKSAIHVARNYGGRKKIVEQQFWAHGIMYQQ